MTLCYVSGRNQKLDGSEDVVFCFKRTAITAHCQKPPEASAELPNPGVFSSAGMSIVLCCASRRTLKKAEEEARRHVLHPLN